MTAQGEHVTRVPATNLEIRFISRVDHVETPKRVRLEELLRIRVDLQKGSS